jgi:O-antigen/teichoic acid export membrane protein
VTDGKELTRYGVWLWFGSIFAILAMYLDVLIVNNWMTAATVGVYALAVNLAIKVDVVNQSLYTVLLPTASALRSREDVRNYIRRGLIRSAMISAGLLPLFPLARPLMGLFLGNSYVPAAPIFQGLLAVAIINILLAPLLMLAFTYDRPKVVALTDGVRALTLLAVAIALVPLIGTTGAVIAKLVSACAGGVIILIFIYRVVLPSGDLHVEPD